MPVPTRTRSSAAECRTRPARAVHVLGELATGRSGPAEDGLEFRLASVADGPGRPPYVERRTADTMAPHRAAEFLAGRRALRSALGAAGADAPGLAGTGGPPRLPAGYVGSVSHSGGLAVAVAGRRDRYRAVGVDLELGELPLSAAHLVLSRDELDRLRAGRPGADARRLLAAFSAKESAYKAIDVLLRERAGGLHTGPALPGLRSLRLRPHPRGFLAQPAGCPAPVATVRVRAVPGGVLTWAVVSERSAEPPVVEDPFSDDPFDGDPFGEEMFGEEMFAVLPPAVPTAPHTRRPEEVR
ncbi:4'-phosphopantetheinyl transferase superfamily protein [Kitasatospora sp. NPDC093558]|uniref:4'-phosphopantetheinyl transferase family protein n=1 Tax=Kitasatospora sp. NPDC093558 TaxID=3155201 RepID=UPI00342D6E9E